MEKLTVDALLAVQLPRHDDDLGMLGGGLYVTPRRPASAVPLMVVELPSVPLAHSSSY